MPTFQPGYKNRRPSENRTGGLLGAAKIVKIEDIMLDISNTNPSMSISQKKLAGVFCTTSSTGTSKEDGHEGTSRL